MRRVAVALLTLLVALGGTVALIGFFQARDESSIGSGTEVAPGAAAPEENDARLKTGNVILTYRRAEDGAVLRALADDIAGPADKTLEATGLAVIVLRRPNQHAGPVVGHALGRRLAVDAADDPRVREFVEYWLGRAGAE
jgi:hypothetical protein